MTINIANKKLEEEVLPFGDTQYLMILLQDDKDTDDKAVKKKEVVTEAEKERARKVIEVLNTESCL